MTSLQQQPSTGAPAAAPHGPGPWRELLAALLQRRDIFAQVAVAALLANLLALGTSLYSMQVYDRVIPSQGSATLVVLTVGALLASVFELVVRHVRSLLLERLNTGVDQALAQSMFARLLAARLEALPAGSGQLSSHLRSMDQVRGFATALVLFAIFDAPFALLFALFIAAVGGPALAVVPLGFLVLALLSGWACKRRIEAQAADGFGAQSARTGMLVEAIAAMETLRAAGRGRDFTARWGQLSTDCADADAAVRRGSESVQLWGAWMQQLSYVLLVASGALLVAQGERLTMGALIACSIVSARVLGPVAGIPTLLVQWAYARVALKALDAFHALPVEGQGAERMLQPARLAGHWRTAGLRFAHPGQLRTLDVPDLDIRPGERVAVLGPVGSGKSTLMRLLAGMVQPSQGHVLIDGLASDQIDRDALRRAMAYMPQDTRLLSGTLRTHLLAGLEPAPDEQRLIDTLRLTGLDQVVAGHPLGLERPLGEGGRGLSAGQRQIAALTRLLLQQQPTAWLLDEPSASMDDAAEARAVAALRARLGADHTLVVATHRPAWLALVSRVIVITSDGRFVVGPRDEVLRPPARGASSVRTVVAAPAATTANASGCVPGAAAAASAPAASTATTSPGPTAPAARHVA